MTLAEPTEYLCEVDQLAGFWKRTDKDTNIAKLVRTTDTSRRGQSWSAVTPADARGNEYDDVINADVR